MSIDAELGISLGFRARNDAGRAIYVLQETLPDFFRMGLVTSVDKATGAPRIPVSTFTQSANINFLENHVVNKDEEPLYSPTICLSYTPPVELPSPFPKTFQVEGASQSVLCICGYFIIEPQ